MVSTKPVLHVDMENRFFIGRVIGRADPELAAASVLRHVAVESVSLDTLTD